MNAVGEHKHDYIEMVMCSHCENDRIFTATETIARLERERDAWQASATKEVTRDQASLEIVRSQRDAARQDAQEFDKARRFWQAEASRKGANAARMRLALSEIADSAINDCWHVDEARAALTPDDGWLARRIEKAVEPYREALLHSANAQHMTCTTDRFIRLEICTTPVCIEAASLLGGTPTKEGE